MNTFTIATLTLPPTAQACLFLAGLLVCCALFVVVLGRMARRSLKKETDEVLK